jgi:transcriptional regulator with XRE-family HTH domain
MRKFFFIFLAYSSRFCYNYAMRDTYKIVSKAIRTMRGERTQREVKKATGLAQETITRLENAKGSPPTIPTLERLADYFQCEIVDFFISESDKLTMEDALKGGDVIVNRIILHLFKHPKEKPVILKILNARNDDQVLHMLLDKLLSMEKDKRLALLQILP